MKRSNLIDEKLIDSIICVAYGDADLADRLKVYFYSLKNPKVKELLREYKQTAGAVHSYKTLECPNDVVGSAKNRVRDVEKLKRRKSYYFGALYARPLFAAVATLIIIAVVSFFITKKQSEEKRYSKAEVVKAEEQVKQSLAIVGKVFRKTENRLTEDILEKQVTPPIKKGFDTINNLLNGG